MPGAQALRYRPSGRGSLRVVFAPCFLACASLLAGGRAQAADALSPAPNDAPGAASRAPRARFFGAMTDIGFPEGAGLSLVARPAPWARFHAGGTFNAFALGFRGGVTFDPMPTRVGVTGTLRAGAWSSATILRSRTERAHI